MDYVGDVEPEVENDPILALRGLGKELLAELGGGEAFLRQLRAGWDEIDKRFDELTDR